MKKATQMGGLFCWQVDLVGEDVSVRHTSLRIGDQKSLR
jgi:hypothetical protein